MEIPIMTNVLHHCDILITYILNRNDGNKMLTSICSLEKYEKSPIRRLATSTCFQSFSVIQDGRYPKMALVGPSQLTVEVKSSDPRDSANDQKSLPRADLLRQIPRLCPASPPSGLTLIGALHLQIVIFTRFLGLQP